jgi:UDP-N-acetylmuramate-alanine ligase
LVEVARDGDVILTLGAGNVSSASGMVVERLVAGC